MSIDIQPEDILWRTPTECGVSALGLIRRTLAAHGGHELVEYKDGPRDGTYMVEFKTPGGQRHMAIPEAIEIAKRGRLGALIEILKGVDPAARPGSQWEPAL